MSVSKSIENSFCPIPWVHVSLDSLGQMRMCCLATRPPFSFLLREDKTRYCAAVDRVPRNNELLKTIRHQMLNGIRPSLCNQCWDVEKAGLMSNRRVCNSYTYPDVMERAVKLTEDDGTINPDDFPLKYYDLRLGNLCNCRCIICNGTNSSMWGKRTDWSGGNFETPFMKDLIKNIDKIDRLYITGGEPTINKLHWKLIDLIIEKGFAKNIDLNYNSNGVYLTKEMLDKWSKFKFAGVGFSIDGMGEIFEKIRTPAKWEVVEKNLQLFDDYPDEGCIDGSFAMTVMTLNMLHIIDFFKWYSQKRYKRLRLEPHFNVLSRPPELDIRRMPEEQKLNIKKEYEKLYEWVKNNCQEDQHENLIENFKGLVNMMFLEVR